MLEGDLPLRAQRLVKEWAAQHQREVNMNYGQMESLFLRIIEERVDNQKMNPDLL